VTAIDQAATNRLETKRHEKRLEWDQWAEKKKGAACQGLGGVDRLKSPRQAEEMIERHPLGQRAVSREKLNHKKIVGDEISGDKFT